MKIKLFTFCLMLGLTASFFISCSDDDDVPAVNKTNLNLLITPPEGITYTALTDIVLSVKEKNTGTASEIKDAVVNGTTLSFTVNEGTYEITAEGTAEYSVDGETVSKPIRAYIAALVVTGETLSENASSFIYSPSTAGFVFKEIFFSGSLTPEGLQTSDQYFIIYNNSDETLYADGLFISDSEFLTVDKQTYTPDILSTHFTASSMIMVPGSGTDHPITPGGSFIIAIDAVNYKEINSNSIDLSKADFEIIYNNSNMSDTDNPDVPNMKNIMGNMVIHNRGFKSYVLGRLGVDTDTYLKDYVYTCSWVFVFEEWSFDLDDDYYKIPNEWIEDAVNLSVESEFQWIVTDPSLDMGWTYSGTIDKDPERYGKSVQRKVAGTIDGREVLMDTNNSKLDFNPQTPITLK
ncbi:MAG: DUF4876 domain-containing protein [Massilibacteroides sp.]|nr:DUF4876 domain-containing protein [Massilibacteroides sp.]MDD3062032.1 DUF4876 domain-containing protein [Massilibacteroides sp.]MDD4114845.1 DUF4876 domain-containing protein [Massilibacteroides sp.]MDD4659251.1 DUF4876 domain-containing protein [Massilibacteroides sp.]